MADVTEETEKLRKKVYWLRLTPKQKENRKEINIEAAKQVPIKDVMQGYGFRVIQETQATVKFLCPLHNEKTGSFVVYKDRNTFTCFGACGEKGDVIDLVMKYEHLDLRDAVNKLSI